MFLSSLAENKNLVMDLKLNILLKLLKNSQFDSKLTSITTTHNIFLTCTFNQSLTCKVTSRYFDVSSNCTISLLSINWILTNDFLIKSPFPPPPPVSGIIWLGN